MSLGSLGFSQSIRLLPCPPLLEASPGSKDRLGVCREQGSSELQMKPLRISFPQLPQALVFPQRLSFSGLRLGTEMFLSGCPLWKQGQVCLGLIGHESQGGEWEVDIG